MGKLREEFIETKALVMSEVRGEGHDPHPWIDGSVGYESRTACRTCGQTMFVKILAARVLITRPKMTCRERRSRSYAYPT
jgi:hypothetical protein